MQLVFVCSGNTCRSPLALAAWHLAAQETVDLASARPLQRIQATSAGLCATPGSAAAPYATQIARQWGYDLRQHKTQLFQPEHAHADLIVTMTEDQSAVMRSHFELREEQVQLLGNYAPKRELVAEAAQFAPLWGDEAILQDITFDADILDPYGASFEAYQACAMQIRRCVRELARILAALQ